MEALPRTRNDILRGWVRPTKGIVNSVGFQSGVFVEAIFWKFHFQTIIVMGAGKAYANRKKVADRPEGDFYATPRSLMWVAEDLFKENFWLCSPILDPCCGKGVMKQELEKFGFRVDENDISSEGGVDYLEGEWSQIQVAMNPPFSQWDAFVEKAKSHASRIMVIGRLNYLSTQSRYESGIWEHLKSVHPFTRYVDYQTPGRDDGCFCVGAMATGWFVWDMQYDGLPTISMLDVQKYATLGNFRKKG